MPLTGFTFLATGDAPTSVCAARLLAFLGAQVVWAGTSERPPGLAALAHHLPTADGQELVRLPVAGAVDGAGLLGGIRAPFPVVSAPADRHPVLAWAASGAMALTGDPDGPPLPGPGNQAAHLNGAALVASLLATLHGGRLDLDGLSLVGERAAIARLSRQGRTSAGGATRLVPASDGWVAVSLTRPADFEVLPAWLGPSARSRDPWDAVVAHVAGRPAAASADAAQLAGLAVAAVPSGRPPEDDQLAARGQAWPPAPWVIGGTPPRVGPRSRLAGAGAIARSRRPVGGRAPVVVDLSSLWAGPLGASLLGLAGARVIKVESRARPDGARRGPPAFFDLLNAGKQSVVLPLGTDEGTTRLRGLLDAADVVIEGARPRVMAQWGIDVEALVASRSRLAWVSITGYGRTGPWSNRVGFGDDTAAAAGMVARAADGAPRFCADAYADPVTGLHAAVAALAALVGGGSHLVDLALRETAGHLLSEAGPAAPARTVAEGSDWWVEADGERLLVGAPTARAAGGTGPPLGRDTDAVLAELAR